MDPRSEVLLRQAELFQGRLLLAGPPADDLLGQLPDAVGWSWHAGEQQLMERRFGGRWRFGGDPGPGELDGAVMCLPKSRELNDYRLQTRGARNNERKLKLG